MAQLALRTLRDVHRVGAARDHAAHAQVAALGHAERVRERHLHCLAALARLPAGGAQHYHDRASGEDEGDGGEPPDHGIGPVARADSRQSRVDISPALNTFDPSVAGSSAAPGQRLYCFRRTVFWKFASRFGRSTKPGAAPEASNALKTVNARAKPPRAS